MAAEPRCLPGSGQTVGVCVCKAGLGFVLAAHTTGFWRLGLVCTDARHLFVTAADTDDGSSQPAQTDESHMGQKQFIL